LSLSSRIGHTSRPSPALEKVSGRIVPAHLVFIDETWARTNVTGTSGWQQRGSGRPLVAKVQHGHWKTMTFQAALHHDRITAPFILDGPIHGDAFTAYVEQALTPTLRRRDVVVLDNRESHKSAMLRQLIRAAGAHLLFSPPYSPDLNLIEQVFATLKTLLRKAEARTFKAVWKRIGRLLDYFEPTEYTNYLRSSGYNSIEMESLVAGNVWPGGMDQTCCSSAPTKGNSNLGATLGLAMFGEQAC
jgi:transposase